MKTDNKSSGAKIEIKKGIKDKDNKSIEKELKPIV